MKLTLKPLGEQVIVIVGASSGIGLATARIAAARGARVVLAARNSSDLEKAVDEIRRAGGRAVAVAGDIADPDAAEAVAAAAIREFGRIDTWINAAAAGLYGPLMDLAVDDMRRQVDVIFWGVVHGSRTAVRHLRNHGGALITVASVAADRALPLQGIYCAAKHAVKGFSDTLRMEVESAGWPVAVSLVKPASVDTPLFEKARSLLGVEPQPVPPVYAPEVVARAILDCAQRPVRDLIVGGPGAVLSGLSALAPRLLDRYMEFRMFDQQRTDRPLAGRSDNLHAPLPEDGGAYGHTWTGRVRRSSAYTSARRHPAAALGVAVAGLALCALIAAPTD